MCVCCVLCVWAWAGGRARLSKSFLFTDKGCQDLGSRLPACLESNRTQVLRGWLMAYGTKRRGKGEKFDFRTLHNLNKW